MAAGHELRPYRPARTLDKPMKRPLDYAVCYPGARPRYNIAGRANDIL
jgi:hypothetical protein